MGASSIALSLNAGDFSNATPCRYRDLLHDLVVDGMNDKNWRSPGGTPWAKEILKDVLRTMPENSFFHHNARQHEALMNMLIIYAKVRFNQCGCFMWSRHRTTVIFTQTTAIPLTRFAVLPMCLPDEPWHQLCPRNERNFGTAVPRVLHRQRSSCCAQPPFFLVARFLLFFFSFSASSLSLLLQCAFFL